MEELISDVREVLEKLGVEDPRILPALKEKWKGMEVDRIWTISDIKERIRTAFGAELTDREAEFLLRETLYKHNAEFGMAPELFDIWYQEYFTGERVWIEELDETLPVREKQEREVFEDV